jgi:DNA anti-recombination protein RmuC
MTDEARYTPDEFFDLYFDFLKDEQVQRKLIQCGIRTWEHEELLFRLIAYVKNVEFITVKREAEFRKMQEWGAAQEQQLEKEKRKFKAWYAEMRVQRREQEQKLQALSERTLLLRERMFGEPTKGDLFTEKLQ